MKLTKAELRKTYQQWKREECEAIELIEAVARFLGDWRSTDSAGRKALEEAGE